MSYNLFVPITKSFVTIEKRWIQHANNYSICDERLWHQWSTWIIYLAEKIHVGCSWRCAASSRGINAPAPTLSVNSPIRQQTLKCRMDVWPHVTTALRYDSITRTFISQFKGLAMPFGHTRSFLFSIKPRTLTQAQRYSWNIYSLAKYIKNGEIISLIE